MYLPRRMFLASSAALAAELAWPAEAAPRAPRRYHVCLSEDALDADPSLLEVVRGAGITDVWVTGFLYGYWHYTPERIAGWRRRVEAAGMAAHVCNVPLGHPGDSLGAMAGDVPLTPPRHWKPGVRPDGSHYAGTSLHSPATEENGAALRRLQQLGVRRVFLDDDFRLAQGPGIVGGCYCPEHRQRFLTSHGYAEGRWDELLQAVARREPTALLREWLDLHCGELTASFRAQQAAAPRVALGIMAMYMGSEKAGIRLEDYRSAPFRVGEGMFGDDSFGPVKGKTNELFSALFHRRFAAPERAHSESTAYPATSLSAANMAAKLAVSTIADVRNTMFMSGLTPFARTHWDTLGPAMRRHAAIHARLAGHRPRGPFRHYWGQPGRLVGDDNPYSLFLACGVPFEVVDKPARDGWTFFGDADARCQSGTPQPGAVWVARPGVASSDRGWRTIAEAAPDLWALKRELTGSGVRCPVVVEDTPAVCAWYPTARAVFLWNLVPESRNLTLRWPGGERAVRVDGLGVELVDLPAIPA